MLATATKITKKKKATKPENNKKIENELLLPNFFAYQLNWH